MKKLMAAALAATVALTGLSIPTAAEARQGCGAGYHRGPAGRCRPNVDNRRRGPVLVIGNYYRGQGYWDGRRYWRERYRHHGGWRYR